MNVYSIKVDGFENENDGVVEYYELTEEDFFPPEDDRVYTSDINNAWYGDDYEDYVEWFWETYGNDVCDEYSDWFRDSYGCDIFENEIF